MDLTTRQTFWNMILGTFVMWSCHVTFSQSCVQRIVSLPTLSQSRQSLVLFCIGVIFIMFFNCFTGIVMYAYYHNCDPLQLNVSGMWQTFNFRCIAKLHTTKSKSISILLHRLSAKEIN